jgi:hypothetical protein
MRVNPQIAALRSNRAPQRQAQAAMKQAIDGWRAETDVAAIQSDFARFGEGATLEQCPTLEELFTAGRRAEAAMASLTRHFCAAIMANPLGHPPFACGFDGRASTLLLSKSGRAQLVLQAREPGPMGWPAASFSDTVRYDAVLAGRAQATIVRAHGPHEQVDFTAEQIVLEAGVRLGFDCSSETLQPTFIERRLVTLRLLQNAAAPTPAREYCRRTGRLLHRASGTRANSRRELMAAALGRMERRDAAPVLADMARHEADASLRWQALRECLALDVTEGFGTLSAIASRAEDELAAPAGALRAYLIEIYPELLNLEANQCPA